jgi:hypothetical protein
LPEVGQEWRATAVAEKEPEVRKRSVERRTGAAGFRSGEKRRGVFCTNDGASSKSLRREYYNVLGYLSACVNKLTDRKENRPSLGL